MKRLLKHIALTFLIILFAIQIEAKIFSNKNYFRYNDQSLNYSILIPKNWKQKEFDLSSRFITIFSKNKFTKIKITVSDKVLIPHDALLDPANFVQKLDPYTSDPSSDVLFYLSRIHY